MSRRALSNETTGSSLLLFALAPEHLGERIVLPVDHAFLQRNDGVVGDLDVLWTDLTAAFGDVAQAEAVLLLGRDLSVCVVQRVHVQLRDPNEEAWPGVGLLVVLVVADDVADVLAQEAFDALAEFLTAFHIDLGHPVVTRLE